MVVESGHGFHVPVPDRERSVMVGTVREARRDHDHFQDVPNRFDGLREIFADTGAR